MPYLPLCFLLILRLSRRLSLCALSLPFFVALECNARSFEYNSDRRGEDYVALVPGKDYSSNSTARYLKGSYRGTSFSLVIGYDKLRGMAYYPEGVEYGESTRYVWISSYYRYFSGITLVDLETSDVVFAAHGRAPELSPDRKRVAYAVDGIYGLLHAVCVNDFVVYPRIRHSDVMITRGSPAAEEAAANRPQMDPKTRFKWLDNSTILFVHSENGRAAAMEDNPALMQYYLVKINGVGEGCTTDSVQVSRAPLTVQQRDQINASRKTGDWDHLELLEALSEKLTTFTENSLQPDIFSHPDWPLLPNGEGGVNSWLSPDSSHLLEAWLDRHYTETHAGVGISINKQPVITIVEEGSVQREMAPQFLTIGPTSRLLAEPRWTSNTEAQLVMQSSWVTEALLGDPSNTRHWLVTITIDDNASAPNVMKKEISRQVASELIR